jgi:hypothetical protein
MRAVIRGGVISLAARAAHERDLALRPINRADEATREAALARRVTTPADRWRAAGVSPYADLD